MEGMNKLLDIACIITRADQDLARESNKLDQLAIIWHAIALLTVSLIALICWTAFFSSFLPGWVALLLGLVVGAVIFQLDQAMGASDWELAGVLREEGWGKSFYGRLALRGGVSFLLAQATAMGVCLWLFSGAIDNRLQEQRTAKNAAVEKVYEGLQGEVKARIVSPVEEELKAAQDTRRQLRRHIGTAQSALDNAQDAAKTGRIEAGREADGLNRRKGMGPRYYEAKRQEEEARRSAQRAQEQMHADTARLTEIETQIAGLARLLESRTKEYQDQVRLLEEKRLRDPRWMPERNDPLLRVMALWAIEADATYGGAVRYFSYGVQIVLITLEMTFLLIKIVFAPASVYTVRLIARTRAEAAQVSATYARNVDQIRRNRPRGNLRIVGGHAEPDLDAGNPNSDGGQA